MSAVLEPISNNSDANNGDVISQGVTLELSGSSKNKAPRYLKHAMNPLSRRACINAVSGVPYYSDSTKKPIIVGSKECEKFFIVTNSMGLTESKDPVILYYDCPEQYERHRHTTLDKTVKEAWRAKIASLGYNNSASEVELGSTVITG